MHNVISVVAGNMTSSEMAELIDIIPAGNTLGEGILWDERGERLWWTDIQERQLLRCAPNMHAIERFALPERLGSFGFVEGSDSIIAAFESGFALYRPETGKLEWLSRPRHDDPAVRFNDGRVDRQGRFWAGSMVEGGGKPQGKLYCFDGSGEAKIHATEIGISNSLCFSPDGRTLYFADTPLRTIFRFDLDTTTGTISNRRIFAQTPEGAYPDGANVDCQGYVWSAHWGAGRVVRYAPDGAIAAMTDVPATQPTCVAFGGKDLGLLFVTSAREGLDDNALRAQPHAGDVFVFKVGISGLPDRAAQIELPSA